MTTENSRADALTIPRDLLNDLIEDVQSFVDQVPCREREKAFRADLLARARAFAGSPSLQPAAAPIENAELASMTRMFHAACHDLGLINEALGLDPNDGGAAPIIDAINELKVRAELPPMTPAPSADERAAFVNGLSRTQCNAIDYFVMQMRDVDSATYTDMLDAFRDYINSLVGPVQARAASANETGAEPVAWRYLTPTGWHATTKLDKALGASAHHDMEPLYAAPQPAQADARVGLTTIQFQAIELAIQYMKQNAYNERSEHIAGLRALLQGADHAE